MVETIEEFGTYIYRHTDYGLAAFKFNFDKPPADTEYSEVFVGIFWKRPTDNYGTNSPRIHYDRITSYRIEKDGIYSGGWCTKELPATGDYKEGMVLGHTYWLVLWRETPETDYDIFYMRKFLASYEGLVALDPD